MSKEKFYITTSIAYTNAPPHIGFALEVIQADVLARHHRSLGKDVFFLTGTDEHGTKVAKAAEKKGKKPKEFADEVSGKFKKLTEDLNLSNDDFIRTTDEKKHWLGVRKVWKGLKEKGDIYKKEYKGLYCEGCEAFITKKDLRKGKCAIHQTIPQRVEEENYFFRLSKYSEKIKENIKKDRIKVIPQTRKNEILSFIKGGLEDISFSRPRKDLKWGIEVPNDKTQTIYVWSDALSNYISAIGYGKKTKKFKKYWPADIHCIGKDILRFHATIWPGMLLSLGLDLPQNIFVHGFITAGGKKMSKSLGNVVDPFQLIETYGTDAVRYYLLREIPPTKDGDFTYQKFEKRYNDDLAKGLGNLLARVRTMTEKIGFKETKDNVLLSKIKGTKTNYKKNLEGFKFNEALMDVWNLISYCDKYIEREKPWEKKKEKKEKAQKVLGNLLIALDGVSEMLNPFLPETAEKIRKEIKRDKRTEKLTKKRKGKLLFPRK